MTYEGRPPRAVVLVEGRSDQRALEALAARRGSDLQAEGVRVIAIGGSKNFSRFVREYGPEGAGVTVAGLYDVGEQNDVQRALHTRGGARPTPSEIEQLGFFECVEDLEDELICALGVAGVLEIARGLGRLGSFRTFQKQPGWQGRSEAAQLRRWLGARATLKTTAAPLLVDAIDLGAMPAPLVKVLAHVGV